MSEKITADHLARIAYVYVRQSSGHQVREHLESQRRQYALAELARDLGFSEVVVIDEDLGVSGTGTVLRPGFTRLLTAVCEGEAGAVFALEASRLARNGRDWHHLMDLCVLTKTLIIDHDGVYAPERLNDRMLLGLKGTMSEFELGLLRQRAQEAMEEMARRGEVLRELPVGYIRTEDNHCEMTPDLQVREAVQAVFAKFRELGSARQVLLWYRQEKISLPTSKRKTRGHEVVWRLPSSSRILLQLKNPTYAGTFVHGRRKTEIEVVDGRARKSSHRWVRPEEWKVVIHDHHEGYISWEEYLENQKQLAENANMKSRMVKGSAREGMALLPGLLRCGKCGEKLHVKYSGKERKVYRYECCNEALRHGGRMCLTVTGRITDQAVAEEVIKTLEPAGIQASLDAWNLLSQQEDEKHRHLRLALEKARYETDRARRQYDKVDPEHRLVASELEKRWNDALVQQKSLEEHLQEMTSQTKSLGDEERKRLTELGQDVKLLWEHPASPVSIKKRILRSLITEIVVEVTEDPTRVVLRIHWCGGAHTCLNIRKKKQGQHCQVTSEVAIELIKHLAECCDDPGIARVLNRLGYRTGTGKSWKEGRVQGLRSRHQIPAFDAKAPRNWVTLTQAAEQLGVSQPLVRRLLAAQVLPGRQVVPYAPWVIPRSGLELPEVRRVVADVKAGGYFSPKHSGQTEIRLFSTT